MKDLERPYPPGHYPVIVIGSGPGGLQAFYSLRSLGVRCALLSSDDSAGGMFRRFPLFQRLISWTKPYCSAQRGTRAYQRYDWNSLIADDPSDQSLVADHMDGTSYFPARSEMEQGIVGFVERSRLPVRYSCTWLSTSIEGSQFVLDTSDGRYSCDAAVIAVGMTQAWKPVIPGIDEVPHYVETKPAEYYRGKRVFIIGKRNSGFEVADALLPFASKIVLGSPRPTKLSVLTRSTEGARARYLQPYEDFILGGGTVILDAAIQSVERTGEGYRVRAKGTVRPGDFDIDVDEVVAATGFTTPLADLPSLGVSTFMNGRLPAQTPLWESASVPGVYFAGSITQGAVGLRKYGISSNSAAVQGSRHNARILARHIAAKHFDISSQHTEMKPDDVSDFVVREASEAPELWNQPSYLARVLSFSDGRVFDEGIDPLALFVDSSGPDAVAITVETDDKGDIHPAIYVRKGGSVSEQLLDSSPMHDFTTPDHRAHVDSIIAPFLG